MKPGEEGSAKDQTNFEHESRELPAANVPTHELLAEIGRRFGVRYGRLSVVFHDGEPRPVVECEHRVRKQIED